MPIAARANRVSTVDANNILSEGAVDSIAFTGQLPLFPPSLGVLTGVQIDLAASTLTHTTNLAAQWLTKASNPNMGVTSDVQPLITLSTPTSPNPLSLTGPSNPLGFGCNALLTPLCPQNVTLLSNPNFSASAPTPLDPYVGETGTVTGTVSHNFSPLQVAPPALGALDLATITETAKLSGKLNVTYSYLNHAQPVFPQGRPDNKQTASITFGRTLQGGDVPATQWAVDNGGLAPNVGLDLTGIASVTPAPQVDLGLTLPLLTGLDAGRFQVYKATLDTAQPGNINTSYQLAFSDSAKGAASSRNNYQMTLNVTGKVVARDPVLQPSPLPIGFHPAAPVSADFNGDGRPDLLVLDRDNRRVVGYPGIPGGIDNKIASQTTVGNNPVALAVGDINNDGKPDAVVANYNDNTVSVLRGDGSSGFQSGLTVAAGAGPIAVALNDLNRDGKLDLVIADARANRVRVHLGVGDGNFGTPTSFASGALPYGLTVADINRDGKLDVAVTNPTANNINVLLGNGNGRLQSHRSFSVGGSPLSLTVADVGGDGIPDLLVANSGGGTVSLLRGTGNNDLFADAVSIALENGASASTVGTADINKDGHPDLVVANTGLSSVDVLVNEGTGTFRRPVAIPVGTAPAGIAVADINADSKPDLVVANTTDTSLSVALNTTVVAPSGKFVEASGSPIAVGLFPASLVSGDFNNDAKLDLAVTNLGDDNVSLLLGRGDGRFQAPVSIPVGQQPIDIVSGDFNRDGKPDLAVANVVDNTVSVLMGLGNGGFGPARHLAAGQSPTYMTSGDINNDGKLDLAVIDSGVNNNNNISVILGQGDGNFQPAQSLATAQTGLGVAMGDLNGDGKPDIAVTGSTNNTVGVSLGLGDGKFQPLQSYGVGNLPQGIALGDINGDGKLDLCVANRGNGLSSDKTVSVLLGFGNGSFVPAQNFAVGLQPIFLRTGDLNGDGKTDLAVTNLKDDNISVLFNLGNGQFQPQQTFAVGQAPSKVIFGDFNNDGRSDIATENLSGSVSVLLNRAP